MPASHPGGLSLATYEATQDAGLFRKRLSDRPASAPGVDASQAGDIQSQDQTQHLHRV
jgi:hypothetical protein